MLKRPKILFFTESHSPTKEELEKAYSIDGDVCFRNASVIRSEHSLEECDGVAGCVPKSYSEKKSYLDAICEQIAKDAAFVKASGDEKPPEITTNVKKPWGSAK